MKICHVTLIKFFAHHHFLPTRFSNKSQTAFCSGVGVTEGLETKKKQTSDAAGAIRNNSCCYRVGPNNSQKISSHCSGSKHSV